MLRRLRPQLLLQRHVLLHLAVVKRQLCRTQLLQGVIFEARSQRSGRAVSFE